MSSQQPISLCVKDVDPPSYSTISSPNRVTSFGACTLPSTSRTYSFAYGNYVPTWNPFNAVMEKYEKRLATFERWPRQIHQKPEEMALGGFYYGGVGDLVICFYCEVRLRNWESHDDIKYEHCKHSPHCRYWHMIYKQ